MLDWVDKMRKEFHSYAKFPDLLNSEESDPFRASKSIWEATIHIISVYEFTVKALTSTLVKLLEFINSKLL